MSWLVYDGIGHTIELIDCAAQSRGKWSAYNNIDHAYAKVHYAPDTHLKDGVYTVVDWFAPHPHPAEKEKYGEYGIIRFNYPGHVGVGVHSGRADAKNVPGPEHATWGCIRTTDAAMAVISNTIKTDPLMTVTVQGNTAPAARHGAAKHATINAESRSAGQVDAHR